MSEEELRGLLETVADGMTTIDQAVYVIMLALTGAYQDGVDSVGYSEGE